MAVIPLDMGAFPALVRPLRDHIRRFGNRSVLCDLVRVFVSVVWLPVSAILDEYQAREDDNGRKRPECSFEYAGPSGLGVGFVGVEDCKNEDGRGTDNEEWRDQHDDVGYYLSISRKFMFSVSFLIAPAFFALHHWDDLHDCVSFAATPSKQCKPPTPGSRSSLPGTVQYMLCELGHNCSQLAELSD